MRIQIDRTRRQADGGQNFANFRAEFRTAELALGEQRFANNLPNAHPGVQRANRVLEHDLDLPPPGEELTALEMGDIFSAEQNPSAGGSRSRAITHPSVVLPEPDSPMRPSVSPYRTWRDTPSTAWMTRFSRRANVLERDGVSGKWFSRSIVSNHASVTGEPSRPC